MIRRFQIKIQNNVKKIDVKMSFKKKKKKGKHIWKWKKRHRKVNAPFIFTPITLIFWDHHLFVQYRFHDIFCPVARHSIQNFTTEYRAEKLNKTSAPYM